MAALLNGYNDFKAGLIGRKLGHSYSPQIHALLADYRYTLRELEPDEIENFLKNGGFDAFNVTIPYKLTVMPFLKEISPEARAIGAVNTVRRRGDGLYGYNTDGFGFMYMLKRSGIDVRGKKTLVLGSGGASHTVRAMLNAAGAKSIVTISRSGEDNYANIDRHFDADVIVNATPVGMYPNNGVAPIDLTRFKKLSGVLDLIYNPCRTKLLCDAERMGIPRENGLSMLVAQAKRSCEIFLDADIDGDVTERIIGEVGFGMSNIILIGMPGCGKSSAGAAIAEKLGRKLIDTDAVIEAKAGMKIADIIANEGEERFRRLEHEAVTEAGANSGCVIATGGGTVTRDENYLPLHANGIIIFMKRKLDRLATDGRPLTAKRGVEELYKERLPLYERFADMQIDTVGGVDDTAERIIKAIKK